MPHDGTGQGWNESSPANDHLLSAAAQEIRDLRRGVRLRVEKEHEEPEASGGGGRHLQGSAKAYHAESAPTNRPGPGEEALTTADHGRFWLDTSTGELKVYTGEAWEPVGSLGLFEALVPTGTILPYGGSSAASGFLLCQGQAVSRSTFSDLFAVIGIAFGEGDGTTTFNLPDLRGEFLRGYDDGRGVDTGRDLGSDQLDQMQRLTGKFGRVRAADVEEGTFERGATTANDWEAGSGITGEEVEFDSGNSPNARVSDDTDGETRPRNVAVNFMIKT